VDRLAAWPSGQLAVQAIEGNNHLCPVTPYQASIAFKHFSCFGQSSALPSFSKLLNAFFSKATLSLFFSERLSNFK